MTAAPSDRTAPVLKRMSRLDFWAALGRVSVAFPLLKQGYDRMEYDSWKHDLDSSPHGHAWHTSFHASRFTGVGTDTCGRAQVYDFLNLPSEGPFNAKLKAMFDQGKDIELQFVRRLAYEGVLLSADQNAFDDVQTGFMDPAHWLTGAADAILLPPHWNKSHCLEIKTTSDAALDELKAGTRKPKPSYISQLKTYIGLAHEGRYSPTAVICKDTGALAEQNAFSPIGYYCRRHGAHECLREKVIGPPESGELLYASREDPMKTISFFYPYDEEHMVNGRKLLAEWRDHFLAGTIPPHHREGQKPVGWSSDPCKYCGHKKTTCKPDFLKKITKLEDSHAIEYAKTIRPNYDYDVMRAAVLSRWGATSTN
jgi:hypothetical protein